MTLFKALRNAFAAPKTLDALFAVTVKFAGVAVKLNITVVFTPLVLAVKPTVPAIVAVAMIEACPFAPVTAVLADKAMPVPENETVASETGLPLASATSTVRGLVNTDPYTAV
jgi:hypothetical protein